MRDLKRAAREGRHAFLVSLARFPKRHPGAISGFFLALLIGGFALNAFDTRGDVSEVRTQIVEVERADPCAGLAAAVKNKAPRRVVAPLTRACVRFLDNLGPLVSQELACAILEEGGYICPRPGSEAAQLAREGGVDDDPSVTGPPAPPRSTQGGDAIQPPSQGRQPPSPGRPGPRTDRPSHPDAPSVPDQLTAPAPSSLPPQSNGKGTPDPPPQAKGPVGSAVDEGLDLGCEVTNPVTGFCIR